MSARGAIRRLVLDAFPWLERLGLTASGDFEVKSATGNIELAGGDLEIARRTDGCTRVAFFPGVPGTTPPVLYFSNSRAAPFVWSVVAPPAIPGSPPSPAEPGTQVVILDGSSKVRSG